jgi:hypothetical protein
MSILPKIQADKKLKESRRDICNNCSRMVKNEGEDWTKDAELSKVLIGLGIINDVLDFDPFTICSECDCVIKYKTALASEKCPIGKW